MKGGAVKLRLVALAWCAATTAACAETRAADVDGSVVSELLAGRTAHMLSDAGEWRTYHDPGGALAVSVRREAVRHGRWWIDDASRYCFVVGDADARCFIASMNASRLELRDVDGGAPVIVDSLAPGDTERLLADGGDVAAPCDCRLTSRRRGEQRAR